MTTYAEWLADPTRHDVWTVDLEIQAAGGGDVTLRYSTEAYATGPSDTPAHTGYLAQLLDPMLASAEDVSPETISQASPSLPRVRGGDIVLGQVAGGLDTLRTAYRWEGGTAVVRHGGRTRRGGWLPRADWGVTTWAISGPPRVDLERAHVPVRPPESVLDRPALRRRYRGGDVCYHQGSTGQATVGTHAELDLTGDLTIAGWYWTHGAALTQRLAEWDASGTTYPWQLRVVSGALRYVASNHAAVDGASTGAERWVHWILQRSGDTVTIVTYDELTDTETTTTATRTAPADAAGPGAGVRLGAVVGGVAGGLMSEWWIDDEAVDLDLCRARRGRPLTTAEAAGVVAYWRCRDGLGTTLTDEGPHGLDGALSGTYAWLAMLEPTALRSRYRPCGWGPGRLLDPTPVHLPTQTYEIASHEISAITAVGDGGGGANEYTGGSKRSTLLDLLQNTPAAGVYDWYSSAHGTYVRLGAAPQHALYVDADGDATGSYEETQGELIARYATAAGVASIDAAIAAAHTKAAGVWLRSQDRAPSWADLISRAALPRIRGWIDRGGTLRARRFAGVGASGVDVVLTLAEIVHLEPIIPEAPATEWTLRYDHYQRPIPYDQQAGSIQETAEGEDLREEWRTVTAPAPPSIAADLTPRSVTEECYLVDSDEAQEEVDHAIATHGAGTPSGWRVTAGGVAHLLDRHDVAGLLVEIDGETRLGLDGTVGYVVLSTSIRSGARLVDLVLWRES